MRTLALLLCTAIIAAGQGFSFTDQPFLSVGGAYASPSWLAIEDFEGAGTPAGWTAAGNSDFDNVTNKIEGSESLQVINGTNYVEFTAQSNVWVYAKVRWYGDTETFNVLRLSSGGTNEGCRVAFGVLGALISAGASESADYCGFDPGSYVSIWIHYTSYGLIRLWVTEAGFLRGAAHCSSVQAPAGSTNVNRLELTAITANGTLVFDHVRVDDVEIGNNPE